MIIIEGSGHAGVGSIFNLSNAEVAHLLGAKAIIVSRGGIGKPVDEISLNKSLFDKFGVEVVGAILNKVDPKRMDVVREYTGRALEAMGVSLLGLIPDTKTLTYPNLSQVVEAVDGRWLNGESTGRNNTVSNIVVGAMTPNSLIEYIQPGMLIITPGDREDILLMTIAACSLSGKRSLAGIVLTRNIQPSHHIMEMISQTKIPMVISKGESYKVASKINSMTVKTLPGDADKIHVIKELIANNVDLELIMDKLQINP